MKHVKNMASYSQERESNKRNEVDKILIDKAMIQFRSKKYNIRKKNESYWFCGCDKNKS